jgi:hypothetical protein
MKQLLLILTVIFSVGLTAQEIKVSGVVNDNTKQPLPGTSILVKGTSREPQPMLMESISYLQLLEIFYNLLLLDMKPKC